MVEACCSWGISSCLVLLCFSSLFRIYFGVFVSVRLARHVPQFGGCVTNVFEKLYNIEANTHTHTYAGDYLLIAIRVLVSALALGKKI